MSTPETLSQPPLRRRMLSTSQILSYCILGTIIIVLGIVAYRTRGSAGLKASGESGGKLFLQVLPNLILGFTIAGLLQVLLPGDLIARWMGADSGWRGLFFGSVAGAVTPGGPFTHFPILAGFMSKGAAVGPVAAYIAGWAVLGLNRIVVWEIPILGWKFVVARVLGCLMFPPICGWLAATFYDLFFSKSQV